MQCDASETGDDFTALERYIGGTVWLSFLFPGIGHLFMGHISFIPWMAAGVYGCFAGPFWLGICVYIVSIFHAFVVAGNIFDRIRGLRANHHV